MLRPQAAQSALLLVLLGFVGGCAVKSAGPEVEDGEGRVITAEKIHNTRALNAWEVLQRSGTNLRLSQTAAGEPAHISSRGRSSLHLSPLPLVIVDGVRLIDFRELRRIPADIIAEIRLYNGATGTRRYGTGAGNGVIVVSTVTTPGH